MSCNVYGLCIVHDGNNMQELWYEGEVVDALQVIAGQNHSVTTYRLQDNIYEVPCVCSHICCIFSTHPTSNMRTFLRPENILGGLHNGPLEG